MSSSRANPGICGKSKDIVAISDLDHARDLRPVTRRTSSLNVVARSPSPSGRFLDGPMRRAAMEDREILDCIHNLVAHERRLRDLRDSGEVTEDVEMGRLAEIEESLDQMWDLLRRRRAMRSAGLDPDSVDLRPMLQANAYIQ